MRQAQLLDIGSTYTKLIRLDLDAPSSVASFSAPTTPDNLQMGVERVLALGDCEQRPALRAACSSAAGGLAVVVSGLVPRLSLEAATRAAHGAGARIVGAWAHRLSAAQLAEIDLSCPQVVLLTGGIDGGDHAFAEHNAAMLERLRSRPAVVVACNRDVSADIARRLDAAGFETHAVANLLPEIDEVDLEPTRDAIRQVFLSRIAHGPGLDEVTATLDTEPVPTPKAAMHGVELLGSTLGEAVMAVEVGGATTNVHSHAVAKGPPPGVVVRGLPAETLQRTVEGDLGVRHNADAVLAAAGHEWFRGRDDRLSDDMIDGWVAHVLGTSTLPDTRLERAADEALALFCVRTAIARHVGRHQHRRTADGTDVVIQRGKDLTGASVLVAVGGSLIWSSTADAVAAVVAGVDPDVLVPRSPRVVMDRDYALFAVGLLSVIDHNVAVAMARATLPGVWRVSG